MTFNIIILKIEYSPLSNTELLPKCVKVFVIYSKLPLNNSFEWFNIFLSLILLFMFQYMLLDVICTFHQPYAISLFESCGFAYPCLTS